MATLQKAPRRMENQQYIFPAEELNQQVQRLKIPSGYLVELSYRKPRPEEVKTKLKKSTLPPQLAGIVRHIESTGGVSTATVKKIEGHFQEFKETFDL